MDCSKQKLIDLNKELEKNTEASDQLIAGIQYVNNSIRETE